jgi:predicted Fe-Mo cluster-binding NifX family protein
MTWTCLFTSKIGEISFSLLKENFIDIYRLENENLTIKQVIELYQQNKFSRMTTPTHLVDESTSETEEPITDN